MFWEYTGNLQQNTHFIPNNTFQRMVYFFWQKIKFLKLPNLKINCSIWEEIAQFHCNFPFICYHPADINWTYVRPSINLLCLQGRVSSSSVSFIFSDCSLFDKKGFQLIDVKKTNDSSLLRGTTLRHNFDERQFEEQFC